jgi:hypothetical protein
MEHRAPRILSQALIRRARRFQRGRPNQQSPHVRAAE